MKEHIFVPLMREHLKENPVPFAVPLTLLKRESLSVKETFCVETLKELIVYATTEEFDVNTVNLFIGDAVVTRLFSNPSFRSKFIPAHKNRLRNGNLNQGLLGLLLGIPLFSDRSFSPSDKFIPVNGVLAASISKTHGKVIKTFHTVDTPAISLVPRNDCDYTGSSVANFN